MKLIFEMKILLFALTSLWLICKIESRKYENYELEGEDLISFLMSLEGTSNDRAKTKTKRTAANPLGAPPAPAEKVDAAAPVKKDEPPAKKDGAPAPGNATGGIPPLGPKFGKPSKGLPNLTPKEIDVPHNYGTLIKGYTFIYGVDDPNKDYKELDEFDAYEVALLIYKNITKEDKIGRIALDLREFAWKCGPKKPCPVGNLYANTTGASDIDIKALKSQVEVFQTKIMAISKVCIGDIYTDPEDKKKAVVFCFNSQKDLDEFEKLFRYVNIKDLNDTSKVFDPETDQSFDLHFSDGREILIQKKIDFKVDGMYEGKKRLMRYDSMETYDGKKCIITSGLPIVPIKFIDVNIFNPRCVAKFKYNKVDTYIGSTDENCVNIFDFIIAKMGTNCRKVKFGPNDKYKDELVSRPAEGKWTGYIKYHKLMDNGGTIDPNPFKLVINPEIIEIWDNKTMLRQKIDHKNLTWSCNDDGDCNFKDFKLYLNHTKQTSKLQDFKIAIKQVVEKWLLQDYNHCFVIEENDIHIICAMDSTEEFSMRLALSVAADKNLVDAPAETFIPYKNGTTYEVIFSTDTNIYFEDYSITVVPEGVKNGTDNLIDYKDIKPLKGIECGFEFRLLSLPNQYHEVIPYCCARYFTDENNFICMQQQSKCYIPLRHMIQLIRTNCLFAQGGNTNTTNPILQPVKPSQDPTNEKRAWSGEVVFQEIDNFKIKGEYTAVRGYLALDPNKATWTVNNQPVITFNLETLNFNCETPFPCLLQDYINNQMPFLEKGYDRDWQQSTLSKFWEENEDIERADCMVVVAEDTFFETSTMILTCATAKDQGLPMRQSVTDVYNKKIGKLRGEEKEMDGIPPAADNREFNALVISTLKSIDPNTVAAASTIIKVHTDGVMYKASSEMVFKYSDIIDTDSKEINLKFNIAKEIPNDMKVHKVTPECCFKAWSSSGSVFFVCFTNGLKCFHDKALLFKTVRARAKRALSILTAELRRKALDMNAKVEDPFSFGLGQIYKKFSPTYNLDNLNEMTFDYSKNGVWEGWVFESALTERNYNKKSTPVWAEIGDGLIKFRTEDDSPTAYKELMLWEYDQLCYEHCQPKRYIEKKTTPFTDFDDMMYLKKTINNMLGQIKNAYVEEGCILMDFTSPRYQFGHSDMICGADKMQGDKIRQAIDNSYYQALLDIDIDKQVRRINLLSDKFFVKIIINEKYNEAFNQVYVDEYGIVGRKMSHDIKVKEPLNKDIFNITFGQIADDNFGTTCAFWYKNLKIKMRKPEMKKVVPDNNCCFKFFTKNDKKKIEICTFHLDGRICIKQSRELMKGMKLGCLHYKKFTTDTGMKNEGQKDTIVDVYHAKTIDDSSNGVFDGFVFIGNAVSSSMAPKANPYYMKIRKMSIEFYEDHTKTDNFTLSINMENIVFNCPGNYPCSPDQFYVWAQTQPKYMTVASQIMTVYNMFRDAYTLDKKLDKVCFILETSIAPFLICPYTHETSKSMQKAIVQAYILSHSCRRLSSVPDVSPSTTYNVTISEEGGQKDDTIKVDFSGVISEKTKSPVFDYRKLDGDPINKKQRCAIWFKEVPVNFEFPNPECCFAISIGGKVKTICVKSDRVCVGTAFRLMKAIWNGCMFNTPAQNIMLPSPDSEILGEPSWENKIKFNYHKAKYDICPSDRNITIFNQSQVRQDYSVDIFNDIAHSVNKTMYKGWFNVYPIDLSSDSGWDLVKYYGELSPEGFVFYENDRDKKHPKMIVRPDMLSMACGKKQACKPLQFMDYLATWNSTALTLKMVHQSKLDLFELKKQEGCAVLENIVANIPNYFIICAHIRKTRTRVAGLQKVIDKPTPYTKSRNLLSAYYGKIIRTIVYDSYIVSRKFMGYEIFPEGDEPVREAFMSIITVRNQYKNVSISKEGIMSSEQLLVKFDDVQHCRTRYNLVYAPPEVVFDNKTNCCFRYMGPINHEYVCVRELNCEYSTYKLARKYFEGCVERKNRKQDILINELTTGDNSFSMTLIKLIFKTEVMYTDLKKLNPSEILSTDEFKTKHKTLSIKYLFITKDLIHACNRVDVTKSKKLANSPQDTTPPDPPAPMVTGVAPRYLGETDEFEIIAAKNIVTQFKQKKTGDKLTVIRNMQFIKSKDFGIVLGKDSEYALIVYNEDGPKILEVHKDRVLLTDNASNLSPEFKNVEQYLGAGEIAVPGSLSG